LSYFKDIDIYVLKFNYFLKSPIWLGYFISLSMIVGVSTALPATYTRTIPAFTPQPQGITALWLVLIAPTHEQMARLS